LRPKATKNPVAHKTPTAKLINLFRKFRSDHYRCEKLPEKYSTQFIDKIQNLLRTTTNRPDAYDRTINTIFLEYKCAYVHNAHLYGCI
jgi:hypothetical protein